jgi:hypothetical protein
VFALGVSLLVTFLVRAPLIVDLVIAFLLNILIDRCTESDSTLCAIIKRIPPGGVVFDELKHSAIVLAC